MRSLGIAATGLLWARFCWSRKPTIGERIPDFELAGSDNQTHRLSDYRGRMVVLNWFPKAYTPVCSRQCRSLAQLESLRLDSNVALLAASCDFAETSRRFARDLDLSFPILSDPWRSAARGCGVLRGLPVPQRTTLYIDPDGYLVLRDERINADQAAEDILANLEQLQR